MIVQFNKYLHALPAVHAGNTDTQEFLVNAAHVIYVRLANAKGCIIKTIDDVEHLVAGSLPEVLKTLRSAGEAGKQS